MTNITTDDLHQPNDKADEATIIAGHFTKIMRASITSFAQHVVQDGELQAQSATRLANVPRHPHAVVGVAFEQLKGCHKDA